MTTKEFNDLLAKAESGDVEAMNDVARTYSSDEPFKDFEKAFYWFNKSAELGHANSMSNLGGWCYLYGNGVKKDVAQAVYWLTKSNMAEKGDIWEMKRWTEIYGAIEGYIDYRKAIHWFHQILEVETDPQSKHYHNTGWDEQLLTKVFAALKEGLSAAKVPTTLKDCLSQTGHSKSLFAKPVFFYSPQVIEEAKAIQELLKKREEQINKEKLEKERQALIKKQEQERQALIKKIETDCDNSPFVEHKGSFDIPEGTTRIGNNVFKSCKQITSVSIPDSVKEIGFAAFNGCCGLTTVTIPEGVVSLGLGSTFQNCTSLTSVHWNAIDCQILPCKTEGNGSWYPPFMNLKNLTTFILGENVQRIPDSLCSNCSSLKSIEIPDTVKSIGLYAFQNCNSLTSVIIPNSVIKIEKLAFIGCTNLSEIAIPDNITEIERSVFNHCGLKSFVLPNNVKEIGIRAFRECAELRYIVIPSSVNSIGEEAFFDCKNLSEIIIPVGTKERFEQMDGIKGTEFAAKLVESDRTIGTEQEELERIEREKIEAEQREKERLEQERLEKERIERKRLEAEQREKERLEQERLEKERIERERIEAEQREKERLERERLELINNIENNPLKNKSPFSTAEGDFVVPDGISCIADSTFRDCKGITSITIPDSVTKIGIGAFCGCEKLEAVHITNLESWCKIAFADADANPLSHAHTLFLNGKAIKKLEIPDTTTSIADYAFIGGSCITSISIHNKIAEIGTSAFENCSGLKSVTIPESVTSINKGATFRGCTSLTTVQWNAINCKINFYTQTKGYLRSGQKIIGSYGHNIYNPPFDKLNNITTFIFGKQVEYIPPYLCCGLSNITSFEIPPKVTNIGYMAFKQCSGLTSISLPKSIIQFGKDGASWKKENNKNAIFTPIVFDECSKLNKIVVPYGEANRFKRMDGIKGTDLTKKIVEAQPVTEEEKKKETENIAKMAVEQPDKVKKLIESDQLRLGQSPFKDLKGHYSISYGVTKIGDGAFSGCIGLTSISIPRTVTQIGNGAFSGCTNLTSVTIADGVKTIGRLAFNGCEHLESVSLPNSVKEIGPNAFDYTLKQMIVPNLAKGRFIELVDKPIGLDHLVPKIVEEWKAGIQNKLKGIFN